MNTKSKRPPSTSRRRNERSTESKPLPSKFKPGHERSTESKPLPSKFRPENERTDLFPLGHDEFLHKVGDRVRGMRANRGMTRKMLSNDSLVSERYLANLEQGKGNISISLLRQVAKALDTDVADLLPASGDQSPEQSLINDFVGCLPRDQQQAALQLLYREFSRQGVRRTRIALIGLRGAGKTRLGQLLGKRQKLRFVNLVDEIEATGGMKIAEILALSGQAGYRRLEEKALLKTLNEHDSCCIETGGSIVSELKLLNLLLSTCFVIWVRTTPEEHMSRVIAQGDLRPMANNNDAMEDLRTILKERTPFYEKAHAVLDTSGRTVEESYDGLLKLIQHTGDSSIDTDNLP